MRETWVQSLSGEDPLEKGMKIHSSIFAWRTPWTEEPGGLQCMGPQESDITEQHTQTHTHTHNLGLPRWPSGKRVCLPMQLAWVQSLGRSLGGGNGNPLQYSFLRDPWTEERGRLQFMGSQRVGHDWVSTQWDSVHANQNLGFVLRPWRRWRSSQECLSTFFFFLHQIRETEDQVQIMSGNNEDWDPWWSHR